MGFFKKLAKKVGTGAAIFGPVGATLGFGSFMKGQLGNFGGLGSAGNLAEQNRKKLLNEVRSDPKSGEKQFDRQTRTELYNLLQKSGTKGADYGAAVKLFQAAKEGTDQKFKSRVATDALHDLLVDRPGSKQTRISGFNNAAAQLFTGRGR